MRLISASFAIFVCLLKLSSAARKEVPLYYDDYYYEDYEDEPVAAAQPADSQYDLGELVKAWKDYIKEKSPGPQRAPQREIPDYDCPPREESYRNPDDKQCDKYYECNIKGEEKEKLCPDGLVFESKSENCDYPAKVNCTGRETLQTPIPAKNCPRANGFFAFPANESCQKFWDCRGGQSYLQVCPTGVIFDPKIDACVTPDQSNRPECAAGKFLGFECPTYGPDDVLRFGNHERLPHPTDCQKFFSCLKSGQGPRLGACPRNTVFSFEAGSCSEPATVPGCETYWTDKAEEELDYEYY